MEDTIGIASVDAKFQSAASYAVMNMLDATGVVPVKLSGFSIEQDGHAIFGDGVSLFSRAAPHSV